MTADTKRMARLAEALTPWFEQTARDLPWRRTSNPYAIWVSEVMLQQTRVETVERYYGPFMRRFPQVQVLAAADEQTVLGAWSGLGYYRRARLLHRGARFVTESLGGQIPAEAAALRQIPGIGAYTSGAIAAIAFNRPEPLVDGNVARVWSRIEAIREPEQQGASAAGHWQRTAKMLHCGSPRVLAQALMELGATVCTPRSPRCLLCPVRPWCGAYALGEQDEIPAPRKRATQRVVRLVAVAAVWKGRILLVRRPREGLLADLWCLPLVSTLAEVPELFDGPVHIDDEPLPELRHVFTHRIWQLIPRRIRSRRRPRLVGVEPDRQLLVKPGQRPDGGIPSVTNKLLDLLGF